MKVHLVDGTYELFRHYFVIPSETDARGQEIAAVRGVLSSLLTMIEAGNRYIGVATDHVIESFRNELYPGYKTSEGVPAALLSQFPILEEALQAMGIVVWPMEYFEADDALAASALRAATDNRVERVLICTPDKDLAQCVVGTRVVLLDRRKDLVVDETGVVTKFGVKPKSIPDYLALVGDSADGFPGLPGWGQKSAAAVIGRYRRLEEIPQDWRHWDVHVRNARQLSVALLNGWNDALLFRQLATLRTDVPLAETVDDLFWRGPLPEFAEITARFRTPALLTRALRAAEMVLESGSQPD